MKIIHYIKTSFFSVAVLPTIITAAACKVLIVCLGMSAQYALAGFSVSGTQLLDGNGKPFIMRGINHPHAWYNYRTKAFADIAATGANTIRVVLSDGQQFTRNSQEDVARVVARCKDNRLVCVLEVHDVTGSGEASAAGTLENATQYWIDIAGAFNGEDDYVIINIANEPYGNGLPASTWVDGHKNAIRRLREAGLTHTLMVDAANWGQDWQEIMLSNASAVAAADNLGNTIFSVHMYEVYQNRNKIESYVSRFLNNHNVPLLIGEFGADHRGQEVDESSILSVAEQYGIGYIGWSWSGNSGCCTSLDIVLNFDPNRLSPWGERLINGKDGIKQTSVLASVYPDEPIEPDNRMCNWYGSIVPLCRYQDTGWGWEDMRSCVGIIDCENQSGDGGVIVP